MSLDLSRVDLPAEVVRTERLVLRPYQPDDVEPVFRACQDAESQRWLLALPSPYTRDSAAEFVGGIAPGGRAAGTDMSCAIEAGGELVGSAGLHALTTGRLGPEVGYWTAPWARGRGYAAEAAAALAHWAFAHGAPRVHLFADVANLASHAVARRAGFTEECLVRACLDQPGGSYGDALLFGRLPG